MPTTGRWAPQPGSSRNRSPIRPMRPRAPVAQRTVASQTLSLALVDYRDQSRPATHAVSRASYSTQAAQHRSRRGHGRPAFLLSKIDHAKRQILHGLDNIMYYVQYQVAIKTLSNTSYSIQYTFRRCMLLNWIPSQRTQESELGMS